MVDRYGEEIEFDLHQFGLDLVDFFRGRYSWRKLAGLIRQLPSTSRTAEAMADDEEIADMILERDKDKPETPDRGPRLSEYSPVAQRLDVLCDRVAELIALTVKVNSSNGKAPRVKPVKRPETAITRAQRRRSLRRYNALVDEVAAAQERFAAREAAATGSP